MEERKTQLQNPGWDTLMTNLSDKSGCEDEWREFKHILQVRCSDNQMQNEKEGRMKDKYAFLGGLSNRKKDLLFPEIKTTARSEYQLWDVHVFQ